MVFVALAFGAFAALVVLAAKERQRLQAVMALDAERRAHELTRGERDGLRDAVDRMADERGRLEKELEDLRALGQGGPFR